jgi:hypothetical protein
LTSLIVNWKDNGTAERTIGFLLMLTSGALVALAGYDRYLAYKHTHEVAEKVRDECDRREAEYLAKHGEFRAADEVYPEESTEESSQESTEEIHAGAKPAMPSMRRLQTAVGEVERKNQ